ncbi:MAG: beta-ketoacyl synthase chain length factor [Proteobacteria bacterium]|nr:beta-ketoacyl synthase chain length factor [Pseudomonadota bacterium]
MRLAISRLAAWAPGVDGDAAWNAWAEAPHELGAEGAPDISALPALLRRRCNRLTRMMLHTAFAAAGTRVGTLRNVFASRHGVLNDTLPLIELAARCERLSPMRFSHSVHNTQAGLFSLAAENRAASSSLGASESLFASAVLEGMTLLARRPKEAVLVVVGDEPPPALLAPWVDEPQTAFAVAFELERVPGDAPGLDLQLRPATGRVRRAWPDTLEFVRFWLRGESELVLAGDRHDAVFQRH